MHVTLTTFIDACFHIAVNSQILAHNEPYTHAYTGSYKHTYKVITVT